jgi:hypothetical protein
MQSGGSNHMKSLGQGYWITLAPYSATLTPWETYLIDPLYMNIVRLRLGSLPVSRATVARVISKFS